MHKVGRILHHCVVWCSSGQPKLIRKSIEINRSRIEEPPLKKIVERQQDIARIAKYDNCRRETRAVVVPAVSLKQPGEVFVPKRRLIRLQILALIKS